MISDKGMLIFKRMYRTSSMTTCHTNLLTVRL